MRKRVYRDKMPADLSGAGWQEAADGDADLRAAISWDGKRIDDDHGLRRRSFIPDPLTLLIAAESGRPILEPIFPLNAFTPTSGCPHNGPIPVGSPRYCPQCHDTGLRGHPALILLDAEIPAPEPAETTAATTKPDPPKTTPANLTRRERRARKYQRGTDARSDAADAG